MLPVIVATIDCDWQRGGWRWHEWTSRQNNTEADVSKFFDSNGVSSAGEDNDVSDAVGSNSDGEVGNIGELEQFDSLKYMKGSI